jgi:hypothetical protein
VSNQNFATTMLALLKITNLEKPCMLANAISSCMHPDNYHTSIYTN